MKTTFTLQKSTWAIIALLFVGIEVLAGEDFAGIHCPDDVYVDCNDEIWDLSIYGNAYYVDYSDGVIVLGYGRNDGSRYEIVEAINFVKAVRSIK